MLSEVQPTSWTVSTSWPVSRRANRRGTDSSARTRTSAQSLSSLLDRRDRLFPADAGEVGQEVDRIFVAIRQGAQIETRDDQGRSPLLLAALNDRLDVARILVYMDALDSGRIVRSGLARRAEWYDSTARAVAPARE